MSLPHSTARWRANQNPLSSGLRWVKKASRRSYSEPHLTLLPLLSLSLQDGEPVNTNEKKSHRVLFKDGALFFYRTMQSKKEQDGGEYWCVAKNHVGKAVSRHASLQIAGKTLDLFTHCATICFMPCLTPLRYR